MSARASTVSRRLAALRRALLVQEMVLIGTIVAALLMGIASMLGAI
ncbi:hypothetical protein [Mesorhizobium sp. J428]|nr:hypothetical protein [Mesorhizobium sp. J428]MCR5855957.1 hypothetical protein [Mesorhizobium sp. J428]